MRTQLSKGQREEPDRESSLAKQTGCLLTLMFRLDTTTSPVGVMMGRFSQLMPCSTSITCPVPTNVKIKVRGQVHHPQVALSVTCQQHKKKSCLKVHVTQHPLYRPQKSCLIKHFKWVDEYLRHTTTKVGCQYRENVVKKLSTHLTFYICKGL